MDISDELFTDLDYAACQALETLVEQTVPALSNRKRMALVSLLFPELESILRAGVEALEPFARLEAEVMDDATDNSILIPPPQFKVGEFRRAAHAAFTLKSILGDET